MPPIRPEEVLAVIPEFVFECFNELIRRNMRVTGQSIFTQKEILKAINLKYGVSENEVIQKHWLDVEHDYRKAGWNVKYESPCRDESFEPYFLFYKENKNA